MSETDGSPTNTGWKRRSRAASFSMCLRYSSSVVAPIARSSPRASIGFKRFAASTAPSAAPAPTIVCSSSMKRTISPSAFLISAKTALIRSSNSPRYFEPARSAPMSSAQTRLPFKPSGHVARDDPLREPLGDRGLPHSGVADQHRVVLRAPREHLDHAPDLLVAPDDGVERALLGELGQVAAELLERLVRAFGILRRDPLAAADVLEARQQVVARDDVEREQEMLGRDVLVLELAHLVLGAVEHSGERGRRGRLLRRALQGGQAREVGLGLRAHVRGLLAEQRLRQLLVEQREQQVLGQHLGVPAAARQLLRGGDRLLGFHCQPLEVHVLGIRSPRVDS